MNEINTKSLDNHLMSLNYDFSIIYQALTKIPDFQTKMPPSEVIGFFKTYTAKLAGQKLGQPTEPISREEMSQYSKYGNLATSLEMQLLYPNFYPVPRKKYEVNTNSKKLQYFKEDFDKLGQSIDVMCVMTGAFIDSVTTSEYLKSLNKDVNLILLYNSTKRHNEDEVQIFDSEKERMRKDVPALIVEDSIQSTTTISRVANYLTKAGYNKIFIFSPQTHRITNGNLDVIKMEPSKLVESGSYVIAQLLNFKPQS